MKYSREKFQRYIESANELYETNQYTQDEFLQEINNILDVAGLPHEYLYKWGLI